MNQSAPSLLPENSSQATAQMTPVRGLLVLAAVVVFVAAYLLLNHALGLTESWTGFLFLVCWAVSVLDPSKLAECAVGAFVGLLVAYAIQALPPVLGMVACVPILGVILAMVYCQIMGWLTVMVNLTTMTFLTIGSMPLVQTHASFPNLFATLALGAAYFAGLVLVGRWFTQRAAAKRRTVSSIDQRH
jgi:hypothetical protein